MKLYLDTEFTGLRQHESLISLGLVTEDNHTFYAEFDDYEPKKISEALHFRKERPWIYENVIPHLTLQQEPPGLARYEDGKLTIYGNRQQIAKVLRGWIDDHYDGRRFEVWSDVLAYDWVFFRELIVEHSGQDHFDFFFYYIPFDLATLLRASNHDPDVDRRVLASNAGVKVGPPHHALNDAWAVKFCVESLFRLMGVEDNLC